MAITCLWSLGGRRGKKGFGEKGREGKEKRRSALSPKGKRRGRLTSLASRREGGGEASLLRVSSSETEEERIYCAEERGGRLQSRRSTEAGAYHAARPITCQGKEKEATKTLLFQLKRGKKGATSPTSEKYESQHYLISSARRAKKRAIAEKALRRGPAVLEILLHGQLAAISPDEGRKDSRRREKREELARGKGEASGRKWVLAFTGRRLYVSTLRKEGPQIPGFERGDRLIPNSKENKGDLKKETPFPIRYREKGKIAGENTTTAVHLRRN